MHCLLVTFQGLLSLEGALRLVGLLTTLRAYFLMMTIPSLAKTYNLPVSRLCDELVVKGKNGHLYVDAGCLCVCFSDDGREPFADGKLAAGARRKLGSALKVTQLA
jgi:hypothetical protein